MTGLTVVEPRWPRKRWWLFIGLVFCAQASLVCWLGETSLPQPRPPSRAPVLRIASAAPIVALTDPTLFALPHAQSFSGEAWLKAPPPPLLSLDWSESPVWLELPAEQPGQLFARFAETNHFETRRSFRTDAALTMPKIPGAHAVGEQSRIQITGELARRRLLTSFELPAWPHNDVLNNSVVSVLVNPAGQTLSADLVSASGLPAADQDALTLAANATFESIEQTGPNRTENALQGLTWGNIIFVWRTVPMTNAPGR